MTFMVTIFKRRQSCQMSILTQSLYCTRRISHHNALHQTKLILDNIVTMVTITNKPDRKNNITVSHNIHCSWSDMECSYQYWHMPPECQTDLVWSHCRWQGGHQYQGLPIRGQHKDMLHKKYQWKVLVPVIPLHGWTVWEGFHTGS